jgi:hypothetical protein
MKNSIIFSVFTILLFVNISFAQDKISEEERLRLENYILKIEKVNNDIQKMISSGETMSIEYKGYFDSLQKKYKKNGYNVDLKDGKFVKEEKK